MFSLPPFASYVVVTKEGDPLVRTARARLIWAANTAEATSSLGIPCLLVGGADAFSYRIENVAGKASAFRALQSLYGVGNGFDLFLLQKDNKEDSWSAAGDFARYVLPQAAIVHTRDPRIALACAKRRIFYILENHDEDYQKDFEQWDDLQMSSPTCLAIVAITEAVREQLIERGFPARKIIVLESGVNSATAERRPLASSRWRAALLNQQYQYLVVYTGGMQAERGIADVLQAALEMPNFLFVMAGGYSGDLSQWRQRIVQQGLSNVRIIGYQTHEVICELQQAADVVLYSRAAEGRSEVTSPLKVFEYLLSGSPIVCATIPSTEALESQSVAIQLYDPVKPASLTNALNSIVSKYPFRLEGYAQNVSAGLKYSWVQRQQRLVNFIGDVHVKITF